MGIYEHYIYRLKNQFDVSTRTSLKCHQIIDQSCIMSFLKFVVLVPSWLMNNPAVSAGDT